MIEIADDGLEMTTREEATFIWLGVIFIACFLQSDIRKSLMLVLRSLSVGKLLLPLLLYACLVAGLTLIVHRLGYWDVSLLGAVLIWFLFTGLKYFLQSAGIDKSRHFFRGRLTEVVGVGAFFEFFYNVRTFALPTELVMQAALAVLACLLVVAQLKDEFRQVAAALKIVGLLAVVGLITATALNLFDHRHSLQGRALISLAILPVWLTLGSLPYIYLLGLFGAYELQFLQVRSALPGGSSLPVLTRLGLVSALGLRVRDVTDFAKEGWPREAATSQGYRNARRVVRAFRKDRAHRAADARRIEQRLVDNAGIEGVDEDGQQLDQREFQQTRAALRWLATCQMGRYQNDGLSAYRPDLLDILSDFTRQGLPAEHGIVMRVRADGQAWYAYRKAVTGWVFAIGASGPPPSQWQYDGAETPNGFPGSDHLWGESMFQANDPNWWEF